MKKFLNQIKNLILDILFPRFCLGCNKEGDYLCEDCLGTIDINYYQFCPVCNRRSLTGKTCPSCKNKTKLTGLFWAVLYQNPLVKKLINQLKYEARLKDVSRVLAGFIIKSFEMMDSQSLPFEQKEGGFVLIPVPLSKNKLKKRGFNQAKEIAKHLSNFWQIPLISNLLIKTKETKNQADLNRKEREENIKGAFLIKESFPISPISPISPGRLKGLKVLLIDDVYTTGSTMSECSKILKQAGARQVWGLAVARE